MDKINTADLYPYRMREFYRPAAGKWSLILDLSAGLTRGALPGLEDFKKAVDSVKELVDGIVVSPGQRRQFLNQTHQDAATLVKADWTNALRPAGFPLPPETIKYIPLVTPSEGLDLGASALVMTFLLGFEEEIEAACVRNTVQMALQGKPLGMPLLVDIHPAGPRVVLRNQAIALGASYAFESGADGIAVPWPGLETLKDILTMAAGLPVWVKLFTEPKALSEGELREAITRVAGLEIAGFWADEHILAEDTKIRGGFSAILKILTSSQAGEPGQQP